MTGRSVAVAVSGGIDSMMAARLLRESGVPVFGIHFHIGHAGCTDLTEGDIAVLSDRLGMPVETVDLSARFRREVVSRFIREYAAARTPNPCLICNPAIKFGALLKAARDRGAAALATGHYARIRQSAGGFPELWAGADKTRDQSYFLALIPPDRLAWARFPLGGLRKEKVLRMAAARGLRPLHAGESQDICFIRGRYHEFLETEGGLPPRPGPITDGAGRKIGTHPGLHLFTVGQRKGINIPASEPYYVLSLDMPGNRLVVGFADELFQSECRVGDVNWLVPPPADPLEVRVKIRYRQAAVPALLHGEAGGDVRLRFSTPLKAVTPGQGAVWYQGDRVLGGGLIAGGVPETADAGDETP
ncbi:MAG: tRNA 2-thiouridine(34) synthase MnmA [Desulfobacterales bacterium]|nr:MAG: tRNA 2-thiouridine(34) synthase MnmA [Desulfobacterales bacterium]